MSPRLSDLLLSSQSDERLVSLARAGHERAFAVIVERYRPELHAMARRLCRDGHSEDVVQQAFLSAFSALRSGSEVKHLRGWLYQIVRNAAGRPGSPPCVPLDRATASVDTLEDVVQQRATAMTALSEIGRLPARQRQAMVGTALDGRGRAEIASSMGLTEGAVRQLVHRARTTLRSAVTALTPWPLIRWITAMGPDAPGPAELAAGAGAASSGGLALKLGALLASGTFLTGAAVHLQPHAPNHGNARAATAAHARIAAAGTGSLSTAAVASHGVSTPSRSVPAVFHPPRPAAHHESSHETIGHGRREQAAVGTGPRSSKGSGVDRHGGRGTGSAGTGGSDRHGEDGGHGSGIPTDRSDGTGRDTRGGTRSDGAAQMVSESHPVDSMVDGSGSHHDSGSREATASFSTSEFTSGDGGRTGSRDGSGSGEVSGSGSGGVSGSGSRDVSGSDGLSGSSSGGGSGSGELGSGDGSGSADGGGTPGD